MKVTKASDRSFKIPGDLEFVRLTIDGVEWDVSKDYVAPVAIGEAVKIARDYGCTLPTCRMVDAIWGAATIKVAPAPMKHDGTYDGMNAQDLLERHAMIVYGQIEEAEMETGPGLIAGNYKDVVASRAGVDDNSPIRVGLYGWHRKDGTVIQPFYYLHGLNWKDYSQGLRLCRMVK